MNKVKKSKGRGVNSSKPKPNDSYVVTNDVTLRDVDSDGIDDVVFSHKVFKNDELFIGSSVVWYGLEPEVADAFVSALESEDLVQDDVVTRSFGRVTAEWKKLTNLLKKINKMAEDKSKELDE